jgi:predicted patatin/cPLA2 family phospholipase
MLFRRIYRNYPELIKALEGRSKLYHDQVDFAEQLEAEGKAIIIRPTIQEVSRLESNEDELLMSYYHGYTKAKEYIDAIHQFME